MFRTFFMKYRAPLSYAVTKVLANHIHDAMVPPRPVRTPRRVYAILDSAFYRGHPVSAQPVVRDHEVREEAPVRRPKVTVFEHASHRPAAVKSNGGLRGSKATRQG